MPRASIRPRTTSFSNQTWNEPEGKALVRAFPSVSELVDTVSSYQRRQTGVPLTNLIGY
jgi:hypothetical protein